MIPRDELATRHRFGRVARIPTPTPLGVGDVNSYLLLPPEGSSGRVTLIDTGVKTPESFAREIRDPIEVDGTLADGDVVEVGDLRLRVIATPGHCGAHVVFDEPTLRVSEVIGHLDMLADEGKLVLEERRGVELARAA